MSRKKERLNDGNYNGQATHGARKHAWRTQAAWAKRGEKERLSDGNNNFELQNWREKKKVSIRSVKIFNNNFFSIFFYPI